MAQPHHLHPVVAVFPEQAKDPAMGIDDAILTMLGEPQQPSLEGDPSGAWGSLLTQLEPVRPLPPPPPRRVGAVATLRVITRALTRPIPWDILLEKSPRRAVACPRPDPLPLGERELRTHGRGPTCITAPDGYSAPVYPE
ncbi:MAG: hypothetical protein Q8L48_19760 [Archangium sp.]|nr:hypothetical protein [Archangium sp.]